MTGRRSDSGVTFGLHVCRGNNQSMFHASGDYAPIAGRVFRRSRFPRFLLEYDDERSGSFEPLRAVPEDRIVVLGLVTTKTPRVETVEELTKRIEAAATIVPLERLALSPQCGFAFTMEGNRISPTRNGASSPSSPPPPARSGAPEPARKRGPGRHPRRVAPSWKRSARE